MKEPQETIWQRFAKHPIYIIAGFVGSVFGIFAFFHLDYPKIDPAPPPSAPELPVGTPAPASSSGTTSPPGRSSVNAVPVDTAPQPVPKSMPAEPALPTTSEPQPGVTPPVIAGSRPIAPASEPGPSSWTMAPSNTLAAAVLARAARPNETSFKGHAGFKVMVTLEPAAAVHPLYAFPMKGGRLGPFYHFISGSGQTSEGRGCEAWLDSSNVYGTWAIEGNALPARAQWTELDSPARLSVSYWCDGPVTDGETVNFDLGLYILDDAGRAQMARWSTLDVPVRVLSVRLTH